MHAQGHACVTSKRLIRFVQVLVHSDASVADEARRLIDKTDREHEATKKQRRDEGADERRLKREERKETKAAAPSAPKPANADEIELNGQIRRVGELATQHSGTDSYGYRLKEIRDKRFLVMERTTNGAREMVLEKLRSGRVVYADDRNKNRRTVNLSWGSAVDYLDPHF